MEKRAGLAGRDKEDGKRGGRSCNFWKPKLDSYNLIHGGPGVASICYHLSYWLVYGCSSTRLVPVAQRSSEYESVCVGAQPHRCSCGGNVRPLTVHGGMHATVLQTQRQRSLLSGGCVSPLARSTGRFMLLSALASCRLSLFPRWAQAKVGVGAARRARTGQQTRDSLLLSTRG